MLKINVLVSQWGCGDTEPPLILPGGEHVLEDPPSAVVEAVAAAAAAGVLEVVEAAKKFERPLAHAVEADEVSLAFKEKCLAIRHELLPARDDAIAAGTPVDEAVAAHEDAVDAAIAKRLGKEKK